MKLKQRHRDGNREFVEGLVLGSLGLTRADVYSADWEIVGMPAMKLTITLHVGMSVTLPDIRKMQRVVETFTTLYNVHFGADIVLFFEMEECNGATVIDNVKLPIEKEETSEPTSN